MNERIIEAIAARQTGALWQFALSHHDSAVHLVVFPWGAMLPVEAAITLCGAEVSEVLKGAAERESDCPGCITLYEKVKWGDVELDAG